MLKQRFDRLRVYVHILASNVRPKYALAYGYARLVPMFSTPTITARLYRSAGFTVGDGCSFLGSLRVVGGVPFYTNLVVERNAVIANDVVINVDGRVVIGESASIGPFVKIYTATHALGPGSRRMMPNAIGKPVRIGRGTWIGAGALVLPGVTIGDGCVVAAGSVVMTDIPENSYAEGNPAKVVRPLPWADR